MNENFRQWRQELANIQTKIDEFDEAFMTNVFDAEIPLTDDELKKAVAEHEIERQKMVAELEAHVAKTPTM